MPKVKVVVIVGPTASGKSNLAVKLARKFGGEIISADSRQVYKGLNVGTGKITKQEMGGVPHHLLDVADLKKQFSVSEYKKLADESVRYITQKGRLPIVVGGTGFYIDVLSKAVTLPDVAPNKTLRKGLGKMSAGKLFKMLKKKDPSRAKTIDRNNKVRLIRALEIIDALGYIPILTPRVNKNLEFIFIGLKLEREELEKRIRTRLLEWIKNGLVSEVKKLHDKGISWKRINKIGLIYHTVAKYLQEKISKEKMIEEIFIEIRRYAKRQIKWFKSNKKNKWFKPREDKKKKKYLIKNLGRGGAL